MFVIKSEENRQVIAQVINYQPAMYVWEICYEYNIVLSIKVLELLVILVSLVIKGCNPKLYKRSMKLLVILFVSCCRRAILKSPHRYTVLLRVFWQKFLMNLFSCSSSVILVSVSHCWESAMSHLKLRFTKRDYAESVTLIHSIWNEKRH